MVRWALNLDSLWQKALYFLFQIYTEDVKDHKSSLASARWKTMYTGTMSLRRSLQVFHRLGVLPKLKIFNHRRFYNCCQRDKLTKIYQKAKVNAAFAMVIFVYFTSSLISSSSRSLNSVFICSGASYQSWVGHGQGPQRLPAPSHCAVLHQRQLLLEEKFNDPVDSFCHPVCMIECSHCPLPPKKTDSMCSVHHPSGKIEHNFSKFPIVLFWVGHFLNQLVNFHYFGSKTASVCIKYMGCSNLSLLSWGWPPLLESLEHGNCSLCLSLIHIWRCRRRG